MIEQAAEQPESPAAPDAQDDNRVCPGCGTTLRDLHTDGRMGCARCYEVFADVVSAAATHLHGTDRHIGKTL